MFSKLQGAKHLRGIITQETVEVTYHQPLGKPNLLKLAYLPPKKTFLFLANDGSLYVCLPSNQTIWICGFISGIPCLICWKMLTPNYFGSTKLASVQTEHPNFWGEFGKEREGPWGCIANLGGSKEVVKPTLVCQVGDQLPTCRMRETLSIPPKNTSISQQNESIWGEDMEGLIQHPDGSNRHFFFGKLW